MTDYSRRQFLHDSLLAAAAAATAGAAPSLFAADEPKTSKSANDKLGIACIGVRGQGNTHLQAYAGNQKLNTEVVIICDADEQVGQQRCEEIGKKQGRKPKYVRDMRDVFADKSIDAISTATPNHWHALVAIWAMQAGKDVYVEKPVSHNVSEGRRIVEAARKYNRICQTGTQCRSMGGSIEAIDYVKSGKIGDVKLARGLCYKPRGSIGAKGKYDVPASVDYNLWCGPAPQDPLTRPRLHYDWHWVWSTGNGDLGNQGIHQMDIARWGLGVNELSQGVISYGGRFGYEDAGETANTQVIVHDYGPKTLVFEVRGLKTPDLKGAKVGVIFEGSDGYVVLTSYTTGAAFDKNGKVVKSFNAGGDHHGNFIKAVRSRKQGDLNADILEGHLSSALCHTGNISMRLGSQISQSEILERLKAAKMADDAQATLDRTVEHLAANGVKLGSSAQFQCGEYLKFDPKTETFPGNAKANEMLTREYRAPFVVPAAGQV